MSDTTTMAGGAGLPASTGGPTVCRCGAELASRDAAWGCVDCGGDCCAECAFWFESTVYCPGCTDRRLAA